MVKTILNPLQLYWIKLISILNNIGNQDIAFETAINKL
jgi:hypothetical protein